MMIYSWKVPLIGQDIYLIISQEVMELEVVAERPVVNQNSEGATKLGFFLLDPKTRVLRGGGGFVLEDHFF